MKDIMTVGKLKEILSQCKDDAQVRMCMDWSELKHPPERLQQQWEDGLGDAVVIGNQVLLLNRHFR